MATLNASGAAAAEAAEELSPPAAAG
eukprot:SAG22_NODE_14665_length_368_cov_1.137546_1_plen_25_part_01